MSIELVIPANHLTLCCPLLLLPSIPPSIRVFSSESVLHIRWPEYWSFSFSISPSNEYSGLISFRMVWSPCRNTHVYLKMKLCRTTYNENNTYSNLSFQKYLCLILSAFVPVVILAFLNSMVILSFLDKLFSDVFCLLSAMIVRIWPFSLPQYFLHLSVKLHYYFSIFYWLLF